MYYTVSGFFDYKMKDSQSLDASSMEGQDEGLQIFQTITVSTELRPIL